LNYIVLRYTFFLSMKASQPPSWEPQGSDRKIERLPSQLIRAPNASEKLADLALDLTYEFPRSPRALFAGYVIAGRMLDKCRAILNGTGGEYVYNCSLDRVFLELAWLDADHFQDFVATGASDEEVAGWIRANAKARSPGEIAAWNFTLKGRRICELTPDRQAWVQEYLLAHVEPKIQERVIFNFDLLDAEEGRLG
jgi:hypothetical protein